MDAIFSSAQPFMATHTSLYLWYPLAIEDIENNAHVLHIA